LASIPGLHTGLKIPAQAFGSKVRI